MKIILVTNNSVYGRYFARALSDAVRLDKIIIEYGRPSWKFYYRKLKKVNPVNFVFQYFLNRWFARQGAVSLPKVELPDHILMENVNRYDFDPDDLVIGFGTSYILPRTLKRLKNGFLNLHTGILPEYRGVKSEFWALYNNDFERAGWTLHYMTRKIDAGDIVIRKSVEVSNENPAQLRVKIIREAAPVIADFINKVRSEGLSWIVRTTQDDGVYYTTPTLKEWLDYRRRSS